MSPGVSAGSAPNARTEQRWLMRLWKHPGASFPWTCCVFENDRKAQLLPCNTTQPLHPLFSLHDYASSKNQKCLMIKWSFMTKLCIWWFIKFSLVCLHGSTSTFQSTDFNSWAFKELEIYLQIYFFISMILILFLLKMYVRAYDFYFLVSFLVNIFMETKWCPFH